jgi:hypothetical protein
MKMRNKLLSGAYVLFCMGLSGCVHGPIRYKTMGYHKYATTEFTKRAPSVTKVVAAPAGLVTDTIITVVDIPVDIIWSIPLVFTHGGPDAAGCRDDIMIGVVTFPFWYPLTIVALNVWPKDMYEDIFGKETGIFRDKAEQGAAPLPSAPQAGPSEGAH